MGEVEYAPGEPKGTPWHPHRGFETVTYMIDGIFEHNDSNGGGGVITNGDTQWMTAGAGILHIEKPPEHLVVSGGLFHGFQLWVNLPKAQKWSPPRYQDLRANEVALAASDDGGALAARHRRRRRGLHRARLDVHADDAGPRDAQPGRAAVAPVARRLQRARSTCSTARARVGPERHADPDGPARGLRARGRAHGRRGASARRAAARRWTCSSSGGRPIREPVAWMGPFVMNTREEVIQAFADYQAGRLGSIPAVHAAPTSVVTSDAQDTAGR